MILALAALSARAATYDGADSTAYLHEGLGSFSSLGWIGDVTGDGRADVGAIGETVGMTSVRVYLDTNWLSFSGGDQYIFVPGVDFQSIAAAGDVNGDGFDDVLAPATGATGELHVFHGSAGQLRTTPSLQLIGAGTGYAAVVAGIGDFDGDGYDDVAIGDLDRVAVDVHRGGPLGLDPVPFQTLLGPAFGWGIPFRAGDLDADGVPDLAVGVFRGQGLAQVDVWYGDAAGFAAAPDATLAAAAPFGDFAAAGDFDGDGADELAVSGYLGDTWVFDWSAAGPDAGTRYDTTTVLGLSTGDLDGDGDSDLAVSDLTACRLWRGGATLTLTDHFSVTGSVRLAGAGPGDADGNGVDDVLCGGGGGGYLYLAWGDTDGDGYGFGGTGPTDCDDGDPAVNPGVDEIVGDGVDGDCDGVELCAADYDDDGFSDDQVLVSADLDCDDPSEHAVPDQGDCDDHDAAVWLGAPEVTGDGRDSDCDGVETCFRDNDQDGARSTNTVDDFMFPGGTGCDASNQALVDQPIDCDDGDPDRSPTLDEVPQDGIDNDCSGLDACFSDGDADGWRTWQTVDNPDADCLDAGEALVADPSGDCDDTDAAVNPGAVDVPGTGIDEDCDGTELCLPDADADGYSGAQPIESVFDLDCDDPGENRDTDPAGDCDDTAPAFHPGAAEIVDDGSDTDCDGGDSCWADGDEDGWRTGELALSLDLDCADPGEAGDAVADGDCDDADADVHPDAAEVASDGVDQDCDGGDRCFADGDGDGFGAGEVDSPDLDCAGAGEAASGDDCDDARSGVYPGAPETCDAVDEDCDGQVDDDPVDAGSWWTDADGDGFGAGPAEVACDPPADAVPAGGVADCDDADPAVHDTCGDAAGKDPGGCGCTSGWGPASAPTALAGLLAVGLRRRPGRRRHP